MIPRFIYIPNPGAGASSVSFKKPYGQRGGHSRKIEERLLREEAKDSG